MKKNWQLKIIDTHPEIKAVEELQRMVWPNSETDVVPSHIIMAAIHSGGILVGAFIDDNLVGFVFGFPGIYFTPDGPRPQHYSHMLAVHPDLRNQGLGFALKRAQWQMVRHQGIDRITWTYDPLLSLNAKLNISRLGAVCDTYLENFYGEMRDAMNIGLPSDRFRVDWWVNSRRVNRRLSKKARPLLDLDHYLAAGAQIMNPTRLGEDGWLYPPSITTSEGLDNQKIEPVKNLLLVEIPSQFLALKSGNPSLALEWRLYTRSLFQRLFSKGYLTTDFVYQPGPKPHSFYIFSNGDTTLDDNQ